MTDSLMAPSIDRTLRTAMGLLQDGRMDEAETLYRGILRDCPDQPDANHNLGIMAAQRGLPEMAMPYLRMALRVAPGAAPYRMSYIQALLDGGQTAAARRALRDGRRLGQDGPAIEALEALVQWAECRPPPVRAGDWFNQGIFHQQAGRSGSAAAAYRKALLLLPAEPLALYWYAQALRQQGWSALAADRLRRALVLDPCFPEALVSLAVPDHSRSGYARALVVKPDDPEALCNLGAQVDQSGPAEDFYRASLVFDPTFTQALFNLAWVLGCRHESTLAIALYRRAQAVCPDYAGAHFMESTEHLRNGDFLIGWKKYEWRWRCGSPEMAPRPFVQPLWDGAPLAGKTILLHAEQGFGDTLQFCRYLLLVAAAGGRVVLEVQPPLKGLLACFSGVSRVIARGEPLPRFDVHLPLMSLPWLFKTTPDSLPGEMPYLTADPARVRAWRRRLPGGRPRVGLRWAGDPDHRGDRQRSLPLALFLPLLGKVEAGWHVLQKDLRPGDAELIAATPALVRHVLKDFADTAALLSLLDLVITVDTAVAHLAGALGRPTWLLLPHCADWRWMRDGDTSPWYPTMRLFRQSSPGNWGPVLARVAEALRRLGHIV